MVAGRDTVVVGEGYTDYILHLQSTVWGYARFHRKRNCCSDYRVHCWHICIQTRMLCHTWTWQKEMQIHEHSGCWTWLSSSSAYLSEMFLTLSGCSFFSAGGSQRQRTPKSLRVLHHQQSVHQRQLGQLHTLFRHSVGDLGCLDFGFFKTLCWDGFGFSKPNPWSEVLRWSEALRVSSAASVSQQTLLGWLQLPWSLAPYVTVTSTSVVTSDVWQALTALRSLSSYCLYLLSDSRAATFAASIAFTSAIMWVTCALLSQFPAAVFATYVDTLFEV